MGVEPEFVTCSHTKRVAESADLEVYTWGPFHGSMSEILRVHLESSQALTLVAGGSAAGYIIDAIQQHGANRCNPLTVLYTCRDVGLFEWMTNVVSSLMRNNVCEDVQLLIAITDGGAQDESVEELVAGKQKEVETQRDSSSSSDEFGKGSVRLQYGRINFMTEIPSNNLVFFQGSGRLQHVVGRACKMNGNKFIAGTAFDKDQNKKNNITEKLRMKCVRSRAMV